ncbi:MAG: DUF4304 domain-containing protein [Planctomycetaceae bacterium]|nr:DUF4304 domain-containing protein [Planctomycetaceae bacterium]
MSEIARLIDQAIRESIAPTLKAHGFRKDGRNFRRREPNCVWIVNVQASAWNSKDEGQFTINLGMHFPALVPFIPWLRDTDRPLEQGCLVRTRIGHLLPAGGDYWWELRASDDRADRTADLRRSVTEFALPWLEKHTDLREARNWVLTRFRNHWWAAAISLALHDRPSSVEELSRALSEVDPSSDQSRMLLSWGQQHGVLPKDAR